MVRAISLGMVLALGACTSVPDAPSRQSLIGAAPQPAEVEVVSPAAEKPPTVSVPVSELRYHFTAAAGHRGGCGSRGGPGYRLSNGKCASWHHSGKHRH